MHSKAVAACLAGALSLACQKKPSPPPPASQSTTATPLPAEGPTASSNYEVRINDVECEVGKECSAIIELRPKNGFHINKEYPYRFAAEPSPALTFLSSPDPAVFSRSNGAFREVSPTFATMTVTFRASAPGSHPIKGSYRFSVCSDEACQVEVARVQATAKSASTH